MKCAKLEEIAWNRKFNKATVKACRPKDHSGSENVPIYFDGEFVRCGAAGTGIFLAEFVDGIKDRTVRHKFLWAVMTAGFTDQVLALCSDRYIERPTLQQISDVNRIDLKIRHEYKVPEFVAFVERMNVMLRAGLLRMNNTGALVIATKPGE